MLNLWKGVQLEGHTQLQSEVRSSCTVLRSQETDVKSYEETSQLSLCQNLLQCLDNVLVFTAYDNSFNIVSCAKCAVTPLVLFHGDIKSTK